MAKPFLLDLINPLNYLKKQGNITKNVLISLIARLLNYAIGIVTLPLVLSYLSNYQYGVFATITSIIAWMDLLDFGLGQGLRNLLAESLAKGDLTKGRRLVSTSYFFLIIISIALLFLYFTVAPFINWTEVLNSSELAQDEVNATVAIIIVAFSLKFSLNLINKIFYAIQKPMFIDVIQVSYKIFYLLGLYLLINLSKPSLLTFAIVQSVLGVSFPFVASLILFRFYKKEISPSFKYIDGSLISKLFRLGGRFLVIQVCLLIMYASNNFMISNFVGPEEVTSYQISITLVSFVSFFFSTMTNPLWSAYTEAFSTNNIERIKRLLKKNIIVFFLTVIATIILIFVSPYIYQVWLNGRIEIPMGLTFLVAIMTLINLWTSMFDSIINSVSKISLQMKLTILAALINIPISFYLAVTLQMGTKGIILGTICSYSITAFVAPYQAYLIIMKKDFGIFAK